MASGTNAFTFSYSLQCQKGAFNFLRNESDNPDFNGNCLFHKVLPIAHSGGWGGSPTALAIAVGGTGNLGMAVFTNLTNVFSIAIGTHSAASPFITLLPGESFVMRLTTGALYDAVASLLSGKVDDSVYNLEVAAFED